MKKIGLESEYFIKKVGKDKTPQIIPSGIPRDESGILMEIRGNAGDPYYATFSFAEEYFRVQKMLEKIGYEILPITRIKLSRKLEIALARQFVKGLYRAQNLYSDTETHRKDTSYHYAGLHVHFSDIYDETIRDEKCRERKISVPKMLDVPLIVKRMDEKYKILINTARRNPGCYELKSDHFEYRSLPTVFINTLTDIHKLLNITQYAYSLLE